MSAKKKLGTSWSPNDVSRMRELARAGKSAREAAKILGRTRGAVAYAAMVREISFHNCRQPRGVQKRRFRKMRRAA